jgi:cytochrome c-type biogenesis protein CcmH/NrfF
MACWKSVALMLFLFLPTGALGGYGDGNARLEKLYKSFISPCCWRENLTTHQSTEANWLRTRIADMVHDGQTDDQIKQVFVAEFGKRILSLPEGSVRVWLFWTPAVLLGAGAAALVWLLQRMKKAPAPAFDHAPAELDPDWDHEA